ncbi:MAG: DUF6090 family protein [Flavobacteriaceae bacterium]|nr:DUF6090 family protein [Flavobacteriaceae bacterium]
MIKFFRLIRMRLLSENKAIKYLLYAFGEIILVVIGILIALQINNWNERKKEYNLGNRYLEDIKSDLEKDVAQAEFILKEHINSISLINSIDSTLLKKEFHQPKEFEWFFNRVDTTDISYIFYRGYSFRPVNGAYNSLISDGKSGLIKNRQLFQQIQEIYAELNLRLESNYENLKRIEEKIHWNYPSEKQNWDYSDLRNSKNDKIFLDLANFAEQRYFYAMNLAQLKNKMTNVVELLKKEVSQK